ncbi:MAG: hypothetical protein IJZ79_01455 [Bacilli bacterium]|nr:hypothetical protein [Bacilli bacterium]
MELTLDYIYDHLMYDLIADGIKYHGNVDYVSSHFGESNYNEFSISEHQEKELSSFVKEYLDTKINEPNLTIEEFYNRKAI